MHNAYVLSTLLYGNETWTTYARYEHRLISSVPSASPATHLGYILPSIVSNTDVLGRANTPSVLALLSQRRLRWLGHVRRMEDGRLPKDVLYGELESGSRPVGRPMLRYKDVCKRDMTSAEINPDLWGAAAADHLYWRRVVRTGTRELRPRGSS